MLATKRLYIDADLSVLRMTPTPSVSDWFGFFRYRSYKDIHTLIYKRTVTDRRTHTAQCRYIHTHTMPTHGHNPHTRAQLQKMCTTPTNSHDAHTSAHNAHSSLLTRTHAHIRAHYNQTRTYKRAHTNAHTHARTHTRAHTNAHIHTRPDDAQTTPGRADAHIITIALSTFYLRHYGATRISAPGKSGEKAGKSGKKRGKAGKGFPKSRPSFPFLGRFLVADPVLIGMVP